MLSEALGRLRTVLDAKVSDDQWPAFCDHLARENIGALGRGAARKPRWTWYKRNDDVYWKPIIEKNAALYCPETVLT